MPVIAILGAAFVIGFEQFVEWRYGPLGIAAMVLLSIGVKAKNPTCSPLGAVVLAVLVTGPALA